MVGSVKGGNPESSNRNSLTVAVYRAVRARLLAIALDLLAPTFITGPCDTSPFLDGHLHCLIGSCGVLVTLFCFDRDVPGRLLVILVVRNRAWLTGPRVR
jgi:hypothetical protein